MIDRDTYIVAMRFFLMVRYGIGVTYDAEKDVFHLRDPVFHQVISILPVAIEKPEYWPVIADTFLNGKKSALDAIAARN